MVIELSTSLSTTIIVIDASIKNDIATSILHTHIANSSLIKALYHAVFVMNTKAKLFAIRYSINQASNKENISKIIITTNSIDMAKKIFDSLSHLFQVHTVAILSNLHQFFTNNQNNLIEFWKCPSRLNQNLHKAVNKDSKTFNPLPIYPCKMLWDYSRKIKCDNILNTWKMTFQASDGKGRQFLNLLDDNFNVIEPSYAKEDPWLQLFRYSNSLCTYAMRAIINHALIGEYRLRFFLNKEFKYPCRTYPIKSRRHILHNCIRFNRYWNPR